jgi:hypothetical protein
MAGDTINRGHDRLSVRYVADDGKKFTARKLQSSLRPLQFIPLACALGKAAFQRPKLADDGKSESGTDCTRDFSRGSAHDSGRQGSRRRRRIIIRLTLGRRSWNRLRFPRLCLSKSINCNYHNLSLYSTSPAIAYCESLNGSDTANGPHRDPKCPRANLSLRPGPVSPQGVT